MGAVSTSCGRNLGVGDCSPNDQRVRECCHLEGETPVEIRIAHQNNGLARNRDGGSLQLRAGSSPRYKTGGEMNNGVISSLGKHVLESGGGVVEAEKPCMPRGADPDRMPIVPSQSKPPGLQARSCSGDGFDPSSFAAPPDSERGERGRERQHKMQFALAAQAAAAVDRSEEHFPEVVRAN
eukprot:TRINITY_DN14807_c0_g2_i1.p1 TRINITY_DN14807_c0_g2~~TRINITY_DN14807_c0_g2_i1.p1  ORF type:complete len:181 (-),score=31.08 TRINITY_DN14807_c0_g2_i1:175-717(-)